MRTDNLDEHRMHAEGYEITPEAARRINAAQRVVAVGTTSLRVLESLPPGPLEGGQGRTDLFVRPDSSSAGRAHC